MPNTTSLAITVLEKAADYQQSLIQLADNLADETHKKRLCKTALKVDKGADVAKAILSKATEDRPIS